MLVLRQAFLLLMVPFVPAVFLMGNNEVSLRQAINALEEGLSVTQKGTAKKLLPLTLGIPTAEEKIWALETVGLKRAGQPPLHIDNLKTPDPQALSSAELLNQLRSRETLLEQIANEVFRVQQKLRYLDPVHTASLSPSDRLALQNMPLEWVIQELNTVIGGDASLSLMGRVFSLKNLLGEFSTPSFYGYDITNFHNVLSAIINFSVGEQPATVAGSFSICFKALAGKTPRAPQVKNMKRIVEELTIEDGGSGDGYQEKHQSVHQKITPTKNIEEGVNMMGILIAGTPPSAENSLFTQVQSLKELLGGQSEQSIEASIKKQNQILGGEGLSSLESLLGPTALAENLTLCQQLENLQRRIGLSVTDDNTGAGSKQESLNDCLDHVLGLLGDVGLKGNPSLHTVLNDPDQGILARLKKLFSSAHFSEDGLLMIKLPAALAQSEARFIAAIQEAPSVAAVLDLLKNAAAFSLETGRNPKPEDTSPDQDSIAICHASKTERINRQAVEDALRAAQRALKAAKKVHQEPGNEAAATFELAHEARLAGQAAFAAAREATKAGKETRQAARAVFKMTQEEIKTTFSAAQQAREAAKKAHLAAKEARKAAQEVREEKETGAFPSQSFTSNMISEEVKI